jgi:hypothetical protein
MQKFIDGLIADTVLSLAAHAKAYGVLILAGFVWQQ